MKRPASRARAVALAIVATGTCATAGETQTDSGRPYTAADVHFMAGMIGHHAQAGLVPRRGPTPRARPAPPPPCGTNVVRPRDAVAAQPPRLRGGPGPLPGAAPPRPPQPG